LADLALLLVGAFISEGQYDRTAIVDSNGNALGDPIAGRDTFDVFKPAAGHLTATIERAGGRTDLAVMVGDSEVDFATAMAACVPSIGVTFGYTTRPVAELGADAVITHYREFPAALEKVLPRG
jgi:phosphoglycolate phosphatase